MSLNNYDDNAPEFDEDFTLRTELALDAVEEMEEEGREEDGDSKDLVDVISRSSLATALSSSAWRIQQEGVDDCDDSENPYGNDEEWMGY